MKEFNWEEFKDKNNKIAVHCKTEEEAKDFCNQMHEHGLRWRWCSHTDSYIERTNWHIYKEETCYSNSGCYCNKDYYIENDCKILEWSDYMKVENKEFTKADLKDGMVVEYRNANRFIVFSDRLLNNDGYDKLEDVKEDLTDNKFEDRMYDIMKVYKIKPEKVFCIDDIFNDENLELIWERTETKRMTAEEMRQKLEELTGEKIEVEPSKEEMIGSVELYCYKRTCSNCTINTLCSNFCKMSNKELKECYEKIMGYDKSKISE